MEVTSLLYYFTCSVSWSLWSTRETPRCIRVSLSSFGYHLYRLYLIVNLLVMLFILLIFSWASLFPRFVKNHLHGGPPDSLEAEALKKEVEELRQKNKDLEEQVAQLQAAVSWSDFTPSFSTLQKLGVAWKMRLRFSWPNNKPLAAGC